MLIAQACTYGSVQYEMVIQDWDLDAEGERDHGHI